MEEDTENRKTEEDFKERKKQLISEIMMLSNGIAPSEDSLGSLRNLDYLSESTLEKLRDVMKDCQNSSGNGKSSESSAISEPHRKAEVPSDSENGSEGSGPSEDESEAPAASESEDVHNASGSSENFGSLEYFNDLKDSNSSEDFDSSEDFGEEGYQSDIYDFIDSDLFDDSESSDKPEDLSENSEDDLENKDGSEKPSEDVQHSDYSESWAIQKDYEDSRKEPKASQNDENPSDGSGNDSKKNSGGQKKKGFFRRHSQMIFNIFIVILVACVLICQGMILMNQSGNFDSGSETVEKKVTDVKTDLTEVIDKVTDSTVGVINYSTEYGSYVTESTGSGIIYKVEKSGDKYKTYIVTNYHVINSSETIQTVFSNGEYTEASLIGGDQYGDIALLETETGFEVSPIDIGDSDLLDRGETVLAIGCPLGIEYAGTVTQGIVSNTDVTIAVDVSENGQADIEMQVIQTDAAINPGNSGGALVNAEGELVGITSSKYAGTTVEGTGYAIPINDAVKMVEEIIETGKVSRPVLGISGVSLSDLSIVERYMYNISSEINSGVYVTEVQKGEGADKAGIEVGDIICSLDDTDIRDYGSLRSFLYGKSAGDKVKVGIIRNGSEKTVSVTLGSN